MRRTAALAAAVTLLLTCAIAALGVSLTRTADAADEETPVVSACVYPSLRALSHHMVLSYYRCQMNELLAPDVTTCRYPRPVASIGHRQMVDYMKCRSAELLRKKPHPTKPPTPTPTPTETTTPTPTESPTPTPTPTPTVEPTPTPTSTPSTCTAPVTINEGAGRTFGEYFVHNNNWNDNYGGTHVIQACSAQRWWVDVNVPTHSDLAVEAYPNVHKDYNDEPLANITSARFAGVGPDCAGCIYNVAFDVWINQNFSNELMIWTQNHGQRPAGTRLADTVIGGHTYQVWKSGGATSPGGIFTYVSVPEQLSGTMPLNLFWADLQQRGWIPANSTTWQVDYGVETVTTNGSQQRFEFTDFSIEDVN